MSDDERPVETDSLSESADEAAEDADVSAGVTATADESTDVTDENRATATTLRRYVNYAVLAGLLLLAFVAVVQFYLSAQTAIQQWITPEYRATFRALFNLVVLLLVGLGVSVQLRRLSGRRSDTREP